MPWLTYTTPLMHVWLCNGSANACEASSEEQSGWSFNCSIFFFFFFYICKFAKGAKHKWRACWCFIGSRNALEICIAVWFDYDIGVSSRYRHFLLLQLAHRFGNSNQTASNTDNHIEISGAIMVRISRIAKLHTCSTHLFVDVSTPLIVDRPSTWFAYNRKKHTLHKMHVHTTSQYSCIYMAFGVEQSKQRRDVAQYLNIAIRMQIYIIEWAFGTTNKICPTWNSIPFIYSSHIGVLYVRGDNGWLWPVLAHYNFCG